jgi:hypothetical protein
MSPHRTLRHVLAALLAAVAVFALAAASANAAGSFGELTRFGEWGKQSEKVKKPTEFGKIAGEGLASFPDERNYAIGVDSAEENSVFVLDEPAAPTESSVTISKEEYAETEHHLRIQKFTYNSAKKAYEATASVSFNVTSPVVEEEEDLEAEQFSNIAVDAKRKVLYVLGEEPRRFSHKQDTEAPVATALYAFKTEASGKVLVPATGAEADGVLASSTALQSESEEPGKALIDPAGIAVDPTTGEVVILAHDDEGSDEEDSIESPNDHFVLQRVGPEGKLGKRYVDTKRFFQSKMRHTEESPTSPVVTESKKVLVGFEGIVEIPYNFEETTEPKQLYLEDEKVKGILEPLVLGNEAGGALALSPEGMLFAPMNIHDEHINQALGPWGIAERELASLTSSTGGLVGWTGGQSPAVQKNLECVLEPGPIQEPLYVAAGSGGDVFALAPEYLTETEREPFKGIPPGAIIEFGPRSSGSGGCPTAEDGAITVSENGVPIGGNPPVVSTGNAVVLSTALKGADALSAEWTIKDETSHEAPIVEKPNPLTFNTELVQGEVYDLLQQPNLSYPFTKGGEYTVEVKVHGDDLATPGELAPKEALKLKVDQAPTVVEQPKSLALAEGEGASFTAESEGFPTPKAQWEVSTDKGVKWTEVKSATSDTLTIKSVSVSESEYEYRARFENEVAGAIETATSQPATLTVTGKGGAQAPTITLQPTSATVTEPATATFTAEASGSPTPTVQWEVSTNNGATFAADTSDAGNKTDKLAVENTTTSESGREYRAAFTNAAGGRSSSAATLTVHAKEPEPQPTQTTPPPTTTPTTGVLPHQEVKPAPVPDATVASTSVSVSRKGALTIKVSCPAGETRCIGTITLRTLTAVVASAGAHVAKKAKRAILTLASGSFSVAGGAAQSITLHLGASARSLLVRSHTLRAKATLVAHDPAGTKATQTQVLTLRLAKH